jgi:hypothetical protein
MSIVASILYSELILSFYLAPRVHLRKDVYFHECNLENLAFRFAVRHLSFVYAVPISLVVS